MDIRAYKIMSGEDILGECINDNEHFVTIKNPVGIQVVRGPNGQPSIGFAPFPIHAEQKSGQTIDIRREFVIYSYVPAEDFVSNYEQVFGTGLIVPNKQIITG